MEYLLLVVSWLIRTFLVTQENRAVLGNSVIWQGDTMKVILMLAWIASLLVSLYIVFSSSGIILVLVILVCYFLLLPALLGKIFEIAKKSSF